MYLLPHNPQPAMNCTQSYMCEMSELASRYQWTGSEIQLAQKSYRRPRRVGSTARPRSYAAKASLYWTQS